MGRARRLALRLALAALCAAAPTQAGARPLGPVRFPVRRLMVGLEGVAFLTPALHVPRVRLDPRYIGEATAAGGAGVFSRWRVADRIALELGVRSGSLRLRSEARGDVISHDLLLADVGVLLYLARGEIGQLAVDGGFGGLGQQIRYDIADGERGLQRFGAFTARVGVDLELLLRRVAVVASLRAHGIVSVRRRTAAHGPFFGGASEAERAAPVPTYQTYVIGSAGLAYRF